MGVLVVWQLGDPVLLFSLGLSDHADYWTEPLHCHLPGVPYQGETDECQTGTYNKSSVINRWEARTTQQVYEC